MAWEDKPTNAQLDTMYRWLSWKMPLADAQNACKWAKEHFNRKIMSEEMTRIRDLKEREKLDIVTAFASENWDGFEHGEKTEEMSDEEYRKTFGWDAWVTKLRHDHGLKSKRDKR